MYLSHKRLEEINEADLQNLVFGSAQESETVEFAEKMWGFGDEDRRDMLREITALGNHRGGELFIGIREADGTAIEVIGVDGAGIAERITSSCSSNIERPLLGLDVHPVPLANGRSVVVARIPLSLSGPHMITFKGLNQFWIRHGRQKGPMTVDEIEAAYVRKLDAESAAERFIESRIRRASSAGAMRLYWSVTPVYLRNEVIDPLDPFIMALVKTPPRHARFDDDFMESRAAYPSVYGVEAVEVAEPHGWEVWRLEVHRTGYTELVVRSAAYDAESEEQRDLYARHLVLLSWRFFQMVKAVYEHAGFSGPVLATTALANCRSAYLVDENARRPIHNPFKLGEGRLVVPSIVSQNFPADVPRIMKTLNDRLWNAFRRPQCPNVDDAGELVLSR